MQSSKVISSWKVQFCSHEGDEETGEKAQISHIMFKSTVCQSEGFKLSQFLEIAFMVPENASFKSHHFYFPFNPNPNEKMDCSNFQRLGHMVLPNVWCECYDPRLHPSQSGAATLTHHGRDLAFMPALVAVFISHKGIHRASLNPLISNQVHQIPRTAYGLDSWQMTLA